MQTLTYKEICQRLSQLSTTLVCDANKKVRLLDSAINSIGATKQCVGRAYTINSNQDALATMQALDDLQAYLTFLNCPADDIVPIIMTIASNGAKHALAGGVCAEVAKTKGFGGIVLDGNYRDIEEIQASGIPFFAKDKCAMSGLYNRIGTIHEKIECGGVEINPGDIIFADRNGIVALTKEEATNLIPKCEEIKTKEAAAVSEVKNGKRFDEICNLNEHIENLKQGRESTLRMK